MRIRRYIPKRVKKSAKNESNRHYCTAHVEPYHESLGGDGVLVPTLSLFIITFKPVALFNTKQIKLSDSLKTYAQHPLFINSTSFTESIITHHWEALIILQVHGGRPLFELLCTIIGIVVYSLLQLHWILFMHSFALRHSQETFHWFYWRNQV